MKLQDKEKLTGKELCDLEGIIFPVMASLDETSDKKDKQEALIGIVSRRGKDIVKLCYLDENNHRIEKVEFQYRMRLINDLPIIMSYVFGEQKNEDTKDSEKKLQAMNIRR